MTEVDDSALLHGRPYDPAKARAYYLRTRHLKGRRAGRAAVAAVGGGQAPGVTSAAQRRNAARRKELAAQKEALNKRLDRLREVLDQLVKEAKKRSGVPDKPDKSPSDPKETTSKKTRKSDAKPLTAKEKRDKAEAARKERAKESHGPNLNTEVRQLEAQVKDIRGKIAKALEDARAKSANSHSKTASKGR